MKPLRRAWNRLRGVFGGFRRESDISAEFEAHIQMQTDDNLRLGMSPAEARRTALLKFGGIEASREAYREQRGLPLLEAFARDVRYALRGMRKSPGFTAVAVLCLALGIGANTAMFTLMNAVLLRSLPVKDPERLVLLKSTTKGRVPPTIRATSSGHGSVSLSYASLAELRKNRVLSDLFAFVPLGFNNQSVTVTVNGVAGAAGGEMVTGTYFSGLGVAPVLGRVINDDDLQPGAPSVTVIGYGYWSRQFGREPSVLGRNLTINGSDYSVVGVAPPDFYGVNPETVPDVWIPLRDHPGVAPWGVQLAGGKSIFADRSWWWCMIMGRLKPGVTGEQARAELDVLFRQGLTDGLNPPPPAERVPHLDLLPAARGFNDFGRRYSQPLYILLGATGLVLLIACANVATLLLARAGARRKEMSVRLAIGASRGRLVRQFLTESVLLALAGGLLGLVVANWGARSLLLFLSDRSQRLPFDVHPNATVLGFTAAVSILTGLLFGLAPALRATRVDIAPRLKDSSAAASGRFTLARGLVAAQVAFSLLLLIGAGLFLRTLLNLERQDLGFDRQNVLLFSLDPIRAGYRGGRLASVYTQTVEKLRGLPGVRSATASGLALLSGWSNSTDMAADGAPLKTGDNRGVFWNSVGPEFFETMGMRLTLGRDISLRDIQSRARVAVVNEAMARYFLPGENPLGHRFSFGTRFDPAQAYEIVGVAQNANFDRLRQTPPRTAYISYAALEHLGSIYFEVRTAADPLALAPSVRQAVRSIDPGLPLLNLGTQELVAQDAMLQERLFARLCAFFGGLALLLVCMGLYGTVTYAVTRRTSEIGIRMALGAGRGGVLWMVLRESLLLIAAGLVLGLPAAFAATRLIESQLYGVRRNDAVTIAITMALLLFAGAAAGFFPARRASRIDPIRALRYE